MKRISMRSILIVTFIWFLSIPLIEIFINNYTLPSSSSIFLSVEDSDQSRYRNMDTEKEVAYIREMLETEFSENEQLSSMVNKDNFMKLDFYEDINILGLLFIENFEFNIFKDKRDATRGDYLSEEGRRLRSLFQNISTVFYEDPNSNFEKILEIEWEREYRFLSNNFIFSFNPNKVKINLENKKLADKIKGLNYKKNAKAISYYYGYIFSAFFIIIFTILTVILERVYLDKNITHYTKLKNKIFNDTDALLQPYFSVITVIFFFLLSIVALIVMQVIPVYFSGIKTIGAVSSNSIFYEIIKPIHYTMSFFGGLYINYVPESRFILLFIMPLVIILYMEKVSGVDVLVNKYKDRKPYKKTKNIKNDEDKSVTEIKDEETEKETKENE